MSVMVSKLSINELLQEVRKKAEELFEEKLRKIILFGSYARGDYDKESDLDIMVTVQLSQAELSSYRNEIAELSSRLSLVYDLTVAIQLQDEATLNKYQDTLPFFENVLKEGVTVHA